MEIQLPKHDLLKQQQSRVRIHFDEALLSDFVVPRASQFEELETDKGGVLRRGLDHVQYQVLAQ